MCRNRVGMVIPVLLLLIGTAVYLYLDLPSKPVVPNMTVAGAPTPVGRSTLSPPPAGELADLLPVDFTDELGNLSEEYVGENAAGLMPQSLPMRVRIAKDVSLLKNETTAESLAMLSEVEMFYWPGTMPQTMIGALPLRKEIGQFDVDSILSNRRFLKLYQELSNMPKEQAASFINDEFKKIVPLYSTMLDENWKRVVSRPKTDSGDSSMGRVVGPGFVLSNNPDHSPTFAGARLKILSLLICCGALGLDDTKPAVREVLALALSQRDDCYRGEDYTSGDRFVMLGKAGIYNRQILATAVIGLSDPRRKEHDELWQTHELTMYDAVFTPYDLLTRTNGPLPADYSKGKQTVRIHVPIDDSEFDVIVKQFR